MERVLDRIAQGVGIDRAECRRRNLIPADQIPYVKPLKSRAGVPLTIDSGDFPPCRRARWPRSAMRNSMRAGAGGRARPVPWHRPGQWRQADGRGPFESARVRIAPSGQISVYTGALAMGQGIATTLAQLCAAHFGVAAQAVQVRAGDTAFVSHGMGGFASRQAMMAGSAVTLAAGVRAKAAAPPRCWASRRTPAAGRWRDQDAGRSAVCWRGWPPVEGRAGIRAAGSRRSRAGRDRAFPLRRAILRRRLACLRGRGRSRHRGASAALRGGARQRRIINPVLAGGQVHGGVAHGIGNALFEWMGYDAGRSPSPRPSPSTCCRRRRSRPASTCCSSRRPPRSIPWASGHRRMRHGAGGRRRDRRGRGCLRAHGVRIAEFPLTPMRLLALIDQGRGSIPGDC